MKANLILIKRLSLIGMFFVLFIACVSDDSNSGDSGNDSGA